MGATFWLRTIAILVGALALAALIWFAGPLLAIGEVRPFEETWVRALLAAIVLVCALGWLGWAFHRRREARRELEKGLADAQNNEGDADILQERMKDALETLRRTKGGRDHLYDLPWYVMIGPPGSGKTTALINSGLKFPLARGAGPEAVAGLGGTRYCDWWFTDQAVLIDTAGRYTTQDSEPDADRASWLGFLRLLKKNRARQPINGVLVAISVEDLLVAGSEEIAAHAAAVRKRLLELHEHLKVDFPVYVLFTKADLIAGFSEFFGGLDEGERRVVWGHTFQTDDRTRNMIAEAPGEYDALVARLNEQLPDRLQNEPTPGARVALFAFPSQVAALKRHVTDFLNRVFEPTRYHANATLRGFYFTSGTQEGTPIDQLIGSLARNFGAEPVQAHAYSGIGKSYFLTDLIKNVVIGEAGWVSTNRESVRRTTFARAASFGALALLALVAIGLWWTSYGRNRELVAATGNALADYRGLAAPVLQETTISDRDLGKVLPLLHKLRHMPAGYENRDEPVPIAATFGLSQRERLLSASVSTYRIGLERMLRPRLIYRLEEQIEGNINNPGFVYEALKVYLMIGGEARADRDFILAWMRRDWAETLFPGAANARGREALEEHLAAMLDLEGTGAPLVTLNRSLVEDAQRTLARMSVAERAYELLKSQARGAVQGDWVVAARGGPDVKLVFEGTGGEDLESIRVPYFYTYDGFHGAFVGRLADIGTQIDAERWVLGEAGRQTAVSQQYGTLYRDIMALYARDFAAAWQDVLRKLKLRPLNTDKPRYVALSAAAAVTSPLKQVLVSLRDETTLTRERPGGSAPAAAGAVSPALTDAARRAAESRASRVLPGQLVPALSSAARTALDQEAPGSVLAPPPGQAPGAEIEAMFKQFHVLLEGEGGRSPIDAVLQSLGEISHNLAIAATDPSQAAAANQALVTHVANLRATSSRFPPPFEAMIRSAANDFEGDATSVSVAYLQQALAEQVTRVCEQVVPNRYPFARGSNREVPLADFARLFAPGGAVDKFFQTSLAPYVDQSRKDWAWRLDSRIARQLSATTLREFQRAAEIREAFFPTGGNMPSFTMSVTPLTLSGDATSAKLEVNGIAVQSQQGVSAPVNLQWPGGGIARSAITLEFGGGGGGFFGGGFFARPSVFERQGVWSFFRLLDAGSVLRRGDAIVATFVVEGREVSYQFNVGSLVNPLVLPALREFRCPTGI